MAVEDIQEIKVWHKTRDTRGNEVQHEAKRTLGIETGSVETRRVYWVQGVTPEEANILGKNLLADPVIQEFSVNPKIKDDDLNRVIVTLKPAQTDPENQFVQEAADILGVKPEAVKTGWEYGFSPTLPTADREKILARLLVNQTVEQVQNEKPVTLIADGEPESIKIIPLLNYSGDQAPEILAQYGYRFSPDEAHAIAVKVYEIGRDFNDLEVSSIEQNWSEHSGHKTTKATLIVDGIPKTSIIGRIKETSYKHPEKIVSAFDDNAGAIPFCKGFNIVAKGETHNWPVNIGPYPGAATREGGLRRDIPGFGLVAHNLFGFDINCFAPPDLPSEKVPSGRHHPDYLTRQNFYGIRDYDNRLGVPTTRAQFYFHPDFRANIVSLGVAFGIVPEDKTFKREPKIGQEIWILGGRTGRDGIGGAVGSSHAATTETIVKSAAEVQMGNPVQEKIVFDALEEGRDQDLWEVVHDLGGGGLSASVSEAAANIGAEIHLDRIKTKDSSLSSREIYLSEAQERMLVIVDQSNEVRAEKILAKHGVELTKLGKLTGDNRLLIKYDGEIVGDLDLEFVRHGCPKRVLEAEWQEPEKDERKPELPVSSEEWVELYKKVVGHWNCSSVEPIVRQYDHGVQGHTVLSSFTGVYQDVLNDAYVCKPLADRPEGIVASHDLHPILNRIDPFGASMWTLASAATRLAVVGGHYKDAAYIDNYIWPAPSKENLGSLDRATDGFCAGMDLTGDPAVSGKDSLGGTSFLEGLRLDIPPVLNISMFGKMPDAEKTASLDFKRTGSVVCLVGNIDPDRMAGSIYYDVNGLVGTEYPRVDTDNLLSVLDRLPKGIADRKIFAAHSVSHGGIAKALADMCFGGDCGVKVDLTSLGERPDNFFNETSGTALVELESMNVAKELFDGIPYKVLGRTQDNKEIDVTYNRNQLFAVDVDSLKTVWQEKMKGVIG